MDQTSMDLMKAVIDKYNLADKAVVDVGSLDINGTYRSLFTGKYTGADMDVGPNVDVLIGSSKWGKISNVDAVISGQMLEHVANIPALMAEIMRILKPGGIVSIIVPSRGPRHDYPIWVGNFEPEQLASIITDAGFELLSIDRDFTLPWYLVTGVGRKPATISNNKVESRSVKSKSGIAGDDE